MKQKLTLVLIAFFGLFLLFYLMEDHPENISETNYWKEDWKSIRYNPPKPEWCGNLVPSFADSTMVFRKLSRSWNAPALFTVTTEKNGNVLVYEGNYNVKNSFSEISVLKTKLIESSTDEIKKTYCLSEFSPSLTVSEDNGKEIQFDGKKQLLFGKKIGADEGRVAVAIQNEIIAPYQYIIEKFRTPVTNFREKAYISVTDGYIEELKFSGQGNLVQVENRAKKNQYNVYVNHWSRTTGERIVLPPDVGNQWENVAKGLKVEFYPDEVGAPQFPSLPENVSPEATLAVNLSNGTKIILSFFPIWESAEGKWRPVVRQFPSYFDESITWMKEDSFQNLVNAVMKVKSASRYERPNQKIQ
ncbi:hypothetical protein LEP1GSC202_1613 [Leptospira yanagawae serovar Saopaulo str. Sao Paulo = ATCC 700523]|uniref:Uncharacterized protein n=2 Tax=Leptospira yanagawae TaxID=293069 RepID=A0ABY2M9N1_9LEPT|nr:hypothetical protein [Leptospira yanagawae]EOQ90029.1 hypothetical protein LEP1GSC202_1613 [Leptospira yanagawae serovar Saopaulo str. Sao Paulo = ATCC 700523]TGL24513.1 hypothetical protein EHQ46_05225 [Leptospira yanagawae]